MNARLRALGIGNATELRQHDWLATVRVAVQGEDAAAGAAAIKLLLALDLGAVAGTQVFGIGIIIVNADKA